MLTATDLHELGDGGAVIVQGGTAQLLAHLWSTLEDEKLRRRMGRELVQVIS